MALHRSAVRVQREITHLCHEGLEPLVLIREVLSRLSVAVPVDTWMCATLDPATLLYTGSVRHGFPEGAADATPRLMHNEFMEDDFNKFETFARGRRSVGALFEATGGVPERSIRYRDIFLPMGLGDELRGALKAGSSAWGAFCLHRELAPSGFTADETEYVQQLAPHLGEGLRASLLLGGIEESEPGTGPGLMILSDELDLLAVTPVAERWLSEMGDWSRTQVPQTVVAVATRLLACESGDGISSDAMPRARARTRSGHWLTLHATRLSRPESGNQIAVIMELARPIEIAPLLLEAYGLTQREKDVARLVLQGWSTEAIVDELVISALTVQQHLKAVFEKVGVRSRRELVAQVFHQRYLPRMLAGDRVGANGWFASPAAGA
jgi:DNA-binding CsgD family transcriptional regulator